MDKLVVISHTPHHFTLDGKVAGWGPTVSELNFLSSKWKEIIHIACIQSYTEDASFKSYNDNIKFVPIPTVGGRSIIQKLRVITSVFIVVFKILSNLKGATHVHIRVPMGIGFYVLPLFALIPRKFILWIKYANSWNNISTSIGYRFQRWLLFKNVLNCKVTINGKWSNQPIHCLSFENPCLDLLQVQAGKELIKDFNGKLNIVFIGRIEAAKGVDLIVECLPFFPNNKLGIWHFLGDGPLKAIMEKRAKDYKINMYFKGFVDQSTVHNYLKDAHILFLPSKTEGFPKVVAEAWNYKVIPVVTPVGSLPHYITHFYNGLMMTDVTVNSLKNVIIELFNLNSEQLTKIAENGNEFADKFTFEYYFKQLQERVLIDN